LGAVAAVGFNLGGNLWLMPSYAALGASWMTAGTEAVIFLAALFSLRQHLPWGSAASGLLKAAAAAALGCIAAAALAQGASLPAYGAGLILGPALTLFLAAWWGLMPLQDLRSLIERLLIYFQRTRGDTAMVFLSMEYAVFTDLDDDMLGERIHD
jgi:O-antigen/teichoic acid export membrane protein